SLHRRIRAPPHIRMGRHGDRGYQRRWLCRCAQCARRLSRQLHGHEHNLDGDGIVDMISNVYSDIDDPNSQVLFFRGTGIDANGMPHFVEDADFLNLNIRGYGETVVIADFNGDGYLDVFLPQYSMNTPEEHSWLLINDGTGHF